MKTFITGNNKESETLVIIDGDNVAFYGTKTPKLSNLLLIKAQIVKSGKSSLILVKANLRHIFDKKIEFEKSINNFDVYQCPAGVDDDLFILETAKIFSSLIISNDCFKEYRIKFPIIVKKIIKYMILRVKAILPDLNYFRKSPFSF